MKRLKLALVIVSSVSIAITISTFALSFTLISNKWISLLVSVLVFDLLGGIVLGLGLTLKKKKTEYMLYEASTMAVEKELEESKEKGLDASKSGIEINFENMNKTFYLELMNLISIKHMIEAQVFEKAGIPEEIQKSMSDPEVRIDKKYILNIAIVLKLNLEETKELLSSAGLNINITDIYDLYIKYFIENKLYNFKLIKEILSKKNLYIL